VANGGFAAKSAGRAFIRTWDDACFGERRPEPPTARLGCPLCT
jgi:hypothetical protein